MTRIERIENAAGYFKSLCNMIQTDIQFGYATKEDESKKDMLDLTIEALYDLLKREKAQERENFVAYSSDWVRIETLEKWLYEIALNNHDTFADACIEIVNRFDGLKAFQKENDSIKSSDRCTRGCMIRNMSDKKLAGFLNHIYKSGSMSLGSRDRFIFTVEWLQEVETHA